MPRSIEGHAEAIGDVGITVDILPGDVLIDELGQYEWTPGLPPGWTRLAPVDPMIADDMEWWPHRTVDDDGEPQPEETR